MRKANVKPSYLSERWANDLSSGECRELLSTLFDSAYLSYAELRYWVAINLTNGILVSEEFNAFVMKQRGK